MLKDAAVISAFSGVRSGDRVVDAGAGSGFLAIYLGSIVAPSGKIYSYEWKNDFVELAARNVLKAGLQQIIEVKHEDVFKGIEEKQVDLVTLDLAGSEKALLHAFNSLKKNGFCVGVLPNVEQAKRFVLGGEKIGFKHEQTIDVTASNWLIREEGCRPETTGVMHTAFLSFLKK
jgi:tRNA (adenine57-N1/adenine58-N1)-methyltransferase